MLTKRSRAELNILSALGIRHLVLRKNRRVPLHVISCISKTAGNVKICVIQIRSESDRVVQKKFYSILEDAMRRASELSTAKVSAAEAYESVKQC